MTAGQTPLWLRRTVVAGLLGGLLLVGFVVMRPFLVAIAWAAIMAYLSWPLHLRVLARLDGSLLWLGRLLRREGVAAVREAGVRLPEPMARIPWLDSWLQERLLELGADRAARGQQLSEQTEQGVVRAMRIVGDLGLHALRFGLALLTTFFLFRARTPNFTAVSDTTHAVVYGLLLAACGLIGLFVGPVILAILLALWREWDSVNADPQQAPAHPESL